MIDNEYKKFQETLLFIEFLRHRMEEMNLNCVDNFRYLEMFVRRGFYESKK